jgi:hypothetical protein
MFHKNKPSISYQEGSDADGMAIVVKSYRNSVKYYKSFSKPKYVVIDFIIHFANNTKSFKDEVMNVLLLCHHKILEILLMLLL